jgi:hypothetical protein
MRAAPSDWLASDDVPNPGSPPCDLDPADTMKFSELILLLPCHSLEDFPVYQEGEQAEGLLAAWSALWHPALLASCGQLPNVVPGRFPA